MSSSNELFEIEWNSLDEFQKELHIPFTSEDEIESIFYTVYKKIFWYKQVRSPLELKLAGDTLVYSVNTTYHQLTELHMRMTWPTIRVKQQFLNTVQVAWCHNLATNHVIYGSLFFDKMPVQTIDSYWFDIVSQYYMKPGFRDHYNKWVGNIPAMENWNSTLHSRITNVHQPFFHTFDPTKSLPLYYFSKTASVVYTYRLRNTISELLRMRVRKVNKSGVVESDWSEIPLNYKYLEGIDKSYRLPAPELWARYAYISPIELDHLKKCTLNKDGTRSRTFYIDDVIVRDSPNEQKSGTISVPLDTKYPTKVVFHLPENQTAYNNRNYSNYSSNADDLRLGLNPIESYSISYANTTNAQEFTTDLTEFAESWHFKSPPCEPGYGAHLISYTPDSIDPDVGLILGKVNAVGNFKLKSNIFDDHNLEENQKEEDDELEELKPKKQNDTRDNHFRMRVRLLVTKKMVVRRLDSDNFDIKIISPIDGKSNNRLNSDLSS